MNFSNTLEKNIFYDVGKLKTILGIYVCAIFFKTSIDNQVLSLLCLGVKVIISSMSNLLFPYKEREGSAVNKTHCLLLF